MLQAKAAQDTLLESEKAARQSAETTAASLQVQLQNATSKAVIVEQVQATTLNQSCAHCKYERTAKLHACSELTLLTLQSWEEAKKQADSAEGQLRELKQQLLEAAKQAEAKSNQVCLIQQRDCTQRFSTFSRSPEQWVSVMGLIIII